MATVSSVATMLFLITALAQATAEWEKPAHCGELDCPVYTVIEETPDYELREYEANIFIHVGSGPKTSWFDQLMEYFNGENDRNMTFSPELPMVTVYQFDPSDEALENTIYMCSYINMPEPPLPTNPNLIIYPNPTVRAYMRPFTGLTNSTMNQWHANQLLAAVDQNVTIDASRAFMNSYDLAMTGLESYNEIGFSVIP